MLLEQRPPLAFGRAAPNTELHLVVERVGEALGPDGTVPANTSRFPLRPRTNRSSGSRARHSAFATHSMRASPMRARAIKMITRRQTALSSRR
jgi:hypothetical protein